MRKPDSLIVILALVAAAVAVFFLTRQTAAPASLTMPPVVDETMPELLEELDAAITEQNPDLFNSLRPGISVKELAQAEMDLGLPIHPDLQALYRWHNGLEDDRELFPGHGFSPLEGAVRLNNEIRQPPWSFLLASERNWLVLFPDPAGDGYYYDPSRTYSTGGVFYTFREDNYVRFFPSLKNLLKAVVEMYAEGLLPYELQPEGFDISAQIAREEEILERYGFEILQKPGSRK